MFSDRGGKVLRLHKPHVLAAGVGQNVTEGMHPSTTFGGERDVVWRIIHLALHSWTRLESLYRQFRPVWPKNAQSGAHDGVAAFETQPAQFLMQANRRQIRVALQQLCDVIGVRVQHARPARALYFDHASPAMFVIHQHARHALTGDSQ